MVADLFVPIALLVGSVAGLWLGARLFVESAVRLARRLGVSELAIGLTVVAVGTSLPEVAVTVEAALAGTGDIAVGNVIGSNVFNLALILGFVALFGAIAIPQSLARRDGVVLFGASALAALVLVDLHLGRFEGAVLVLALVGYLLVLARTGAAPTAERENGSLRRRDPVLLVAGLGLVLVSGTVLVDAAVTLAWTVGVSEWAIGATVVAAGTSTPEFAVSVLALRRGQVGVSIGNLLGSNVFNALGVLGIAGLVRPLTIDSAALADLGWLLVVTGFVTVSLWSGHRLSRAEGGALVGSELTRWALGFLR